MRFEEVEDVDCHIQEYTLRVSIIPGSHSPTRSARLS
jgi:hypothetical protein